MSRHRTFTEDLGAAALALKKMKLQLVLLFFAFAALSSVSHGTLIGHRHHVVASAAKLGLNARDAKTVMETVKTSKDALKGLRGRFAGADDVSVPFMSKASALLKQLGANPTMLQKQKVLESLNISDIANQVSLGEVFGLADLLGFPRDDVESAVSEIIGFLDSLTIADMPALLTDMHGLLLEMGVPNGSLLAAIDMLEDKAKEILLYFYEAVSS